MPRRICAIPATNIQAARRRPAGYESRTATMCPEKRDEVVSLGLKSIVSGTLTTCLLGAIVGVLS